MALKASIDIGTNTVLLLVADVDNGAITTVDHEQRIPRIGKGVDSDRNIAADRIELLMEVLKEYSQKIGQYGISAEEVVVTATSAMRDAANRDVIISRVREETGFQIKLLSGEEEAKMSWQGALVNLRQNDEKVLVIDIGGGSTELAIGTANAAFPDFNISLDMGSVRVTERYLQSAVPTVGEVKSLQNELRRMLIGAQAPSRDLKGAIAVAGTASTAAAMILNPLPQNYTDLHGVIIHENELNRLIKAVCGMGASQRLQTWPIWLEGRADIIPAGLVILKTVLEWFGMNEFKVSLGGIRYGALI